MDIAATELQFGAVCGEIAVELGVWTGRGAVVAVSPTPPVVRRQRGECPRPRETTRWPPLPRSTTDLPSSAKSTHYLRNLPPTFLVSWHLSPRRDTQPGRTYFFSTPTTSSSRQARQEPLTSLLHSFSLHNTFSTPHSLYFFLHCFHKRFNNSRHMYRNITLLHSVHPYFFLFNIYCFFSLHTRILYYSSL